MKGKRHKKAKPVYGYGINDADYIVDQVVSGKREVCPYYSRWTKMMERCYSGKRHEVKPSYRDCSVCDEWLYFSNFKKWMACQDWEGKQLDKDILVPGNRIYSPDACIFVTSEINLLLSAGKKSKSGLPRGVSKDHRSGRYVTHCRTGRKSAHIGTFTSSLEAAEAYKLAKAEYIRFVAGNQSGPLMSALLRHAEIVEVQLCSI